MALVGIELETLVSELFLFFFFNSNVMLLIHKKKCPVFAFCLSFCLILFISLFFFDKNKVVTKEIKLFITVSLIIFQKQRFVANSQKKSAVFAFHLSFSLMKSKWSKEK